MMFDCEPVEASGEGRLNASGVRWTEARTWTEAILMKLGHAVYMLGCWVSLFGLGGALLGVLPPFVPLVGGLLIAAAWGVFRLAWRVPGRKRELTFWRDGESSAPFGLSPWPVSHNSLAWPHAQIVSIEAEQVVTPKGEDPTTYTHGVRIFWKGGRVAHVAQNLEPDDAHMLAVRLTEALAALREDMATAVQRVGQTRPPQRGSAKPERHYVID